MNFEETIKKIRKEKKLTQEEMANKLFVSRQAISNWENGKNLPDIEMIIMISKVFSLSLDELILGGKNMNDITKKLINDGSENKRTKMNLTLTIIGSILLLLGILCIIIKGLSVEYIDEEGFLHENFFLLPIGFLFIFSSIITFLSMGIKNIVYKIKHKR